MPGFELEAVEGDEYRGVVKVKVGPITAQYKGVASFRERDEANHRAVVRAEGRDTRGQGNASATVTATLAPEGGGTRVSVHTDLAITGKVAQFGRGVLADVSSRLLGEFVRALEANVLLGAAATRSGAPGAAEAVQVERPPPNEERLATKSGTRDEAGTPAATAPARRVASPSGEPIDLLATAGSSVLKRVGPLVVALAAAIWL